MPERLSDELCNRSPQHLPPQEYWLHNPYEEGLIPTPYDRNGLVDADKLLELIAATIDPAYPWELLNLKNVHHWQCPEVSYPGNSPGSPIRRPNPHAFRNLQSRQWQLPTELHNWIHAVMEVPIVPADDVMRGTIKAYELVVILHAAIRSSKERQEDPENKHPARLALNNDRISQRFEALQSMPTEFRPNLSGHRANNVPKLLTLEETLGKFVTRKTSEQALSVMRQIRPSPDAIAA